MRFRKFLNPYKTRDSSFREYTDIEGGELEALKGMKNLIKERKPYLAICIYHKETDLYDIPYYIQSLCSDYRFFIRGGWHLECWAVPEKHFQKENN